MSDSLWPHELQHATFPCPSLSPWVCSNSYPLSQGCHSTILHFVTPFSYWPESFHQSLFQWVSSSHQVAKELELWLQHQPFQWIFMVDFLWDWLVWSPCCPRDSQEASLAPQFESINSSVFSLLYGSTLTSMCVCLAAQSCLTFCDLMDCSLPGSFVHGDYTWLLEKS